MLARRAAVTAVCRDDHALAAAICTLPDVLVQNSKDGQSRRNLLSLCKYAGYRKSFWLTA